MRDPSLAWPSTVRQPATSAELEVALRCVHEAAHGLAASAVSSRGLIDLEVTDAHRSEDGTGGWCRWQTDCPRDEDLALVAPAVATRAYLVRASQDSAHNLAWNETTFAADRGRISSSRSVAELEAEAAPLVSGAALETVLDLADVLVIDGYLTAEHPKVRGIVAQHRALLPPSEHVPGRRTPFRPPHPTLGGFAMSVDEIRAGIAEVEQRVATAAHQLNTVQTEIEQAAGLLAQVSAGSNATELSEALGTLRDLSTELEQAGQRALSTGESALDYAGRL